MRQDMDNSKKSEELIIANKELAFQNKEKEKRAAELIIADKELAFQKEEKKKRAAELIIADKELAFQKEEKEKRAAELIIADKELDFQNEEKGKRAAELAIANKELAYQNEEKEKRAEELIIANKELLFQNEEKEKRAKELIVANKELAFQNREKEKRDDELIIANKELAYQNKEKGKRADELIITNKELLFQNEEKEKRAAELNENKTLLASVLDSSLSGIMAFKSIRNDEGAIMDFEWQLVNAAAEQMVRHSQTEILGKRLLEEMPGNRVEGLFDLYVQVVETGIPLSLEHYYEHEKVKTWFHTVAIKRLDGFVVTFFNITGRKLAEKELSIANKELALQNEEKENRAAELIVANKKLAFENEEKGKRADELIIANKELLFQNEEKEKRAVELIKAREHAEESDRLKSAFLANMSHEIRTPMNGILGFADLLQEMKLTGEEQQEYIGIIKQSGDRMLNIINDIMSISKVEAGQMDVHISEVDINEKIEYIQTFFKPEADKKGLKISCKTALTANKAIIKTDKEKIYAILTNLVKNALKFTHEGAIEFGYEKKGDHLEFFVKDTGIGIRPEQKGIIFERFRQVSESYSRDYQGTGLGLSISKAYVEMLGGKIWVESEFGKGSVFYFTLPYHVEAEEKIGIQHVVPEDPEENKIKNLNILIVDDDEISEKLLSKALIPSCKEILKVRTGAEAIEACLKHPYIDLILMDIQLPEMDGYEATQQIRKFNKGVIIIAQTAFALSGDRIKAIEAGCNDHISKPVKKDKLEELLLKYFKKKMEYTF
jgi:signal transduction histidine kinase/ActR/RegA family two-component response regulator